MPRLSQNADLAPVRWPDTNRFLGGYAAPTTLFDDRFNHSFCGWRQHMGGDQNSPQLSLTDIRTDSESERALWLTTSARPARSSAPAILSGGNVTYKNQSLFSRTGVIKFEAWIAIGGTNLDKAPQQWFIGMDTQRWDDQSRGFFKLTNRRFDGSGSRVNQWIINDDAGNPVTITDTSNTSGNPYSIGDNENKMNVFHVGLYQDLDAVVSADGKPGGYLAAEIGGKTYDLRGLGAGRGKQPPQLTSSVGGGPFTGGWNCGIGLNNQTVNNEDGPSWLIVTRARALHYEKIGA